jgi:hypothetical protein
METLEKIELVLSHIQNVQNNCYKLGMKLIKRGEIEMGRILIAHGQVHDNSKFQGVEFDHLFTGDSILSDAIKTAPIRIILSIGVFQKLRVI